MYIVVEGCDFWSGLGDGLLSPLAAKDAKQLLVVMVLATDMANHGSDLGLLKAKLEAEGGSSGTWQLQPGEPHKADRALALKVCYVRARSDGPQRMSPQRVRPRERAQRNGGGEGGGVKATKAAQTWRWVS